MISKLNKILSVVAFSFGVGAANVQAAPPPAEADFPGGIDHPLVSRYEGSLLIMSGEDNLGSAEIIVADKGKPVPKSIEGKISNRQYWAPKGRSPLEVIRNYQKALMAAGFEILFSCETAQCESMKVQSLVQDFPRKAKWQKFDSPVVGIFNSANKPLFNYLSARKVSGGSTVHVQIGLCGTFDSDGKQAGRAPQFMQIIESAQLDEGKVTVDSAAIGSALKREGKIALYGILFDTNKAVIKPESNATLDEMAKALNAEPATKVFIVGHTDNVGSVEANLPLSQRRAEAVVEVLTKKYGITADRLQARGVANFAPVANNLDEPNRGKNRRVEMVVR